jgi:hypothetical protein
MENKNIFWGVLLVSIGALVLLDNADMIDFSFSALMSLWPLLLVYWGVTMLPIKGLFKTLIGLAIIVFALVYSSISDDKFWWEDKINTKFIHQFDNDDFDDSDTTSASENYYTFKFTKEADKTIDEATLQMDVAAGKFRIEEVTTEEIMFFEAYSNIGPYTSNMVTNANKADIHIEKGDAMMKNGTNKNRATVKLNPDVTWDLNFDVGAADFRGDFTPFKIRNIDIDGGASAIKVKLGSLLNETHIKLDAGAASIKFEIPQNAGCKIQSESFLVEMDFEGFTKKDNGEYVSDNFEQSQQKIYLEIDAAISQLSIQRY